MKLQPENDPFWKGPKRAWLCRFVGHGRQGLDDEENFIDYCPRCGTVLHRKRSPNHYADQPKLRTWDDNPAHRAANDGLGMCNTGSGHKGVCALGGIGCDVDHIAVARQNLSGRQRVVRRGDLEAYEGAAPDGDGWVEVREI